MRVRDTMTRSVMYVSPDDTLDEAYDLMLSQEIRHLPVVEGTALVGVISDRDVLLRANMEDGVVTVPQVTVSEAMTRDPLTCDTRASISEAATLMIENKISCLPVTAVGELIGMVTSTDLLDVLCRERGESNVQHLPFKFNLSRYPGRSTANANPWG